MSEARRLLLLSTSTLFGSGYLDYAEAEVREFLGEVRRILFVPFALHDQETYAESVRARFVRMNAEVHSLHAAGDMVQAVKAADAIFVGGGNSFRLLKSLYDFDLLSPIRGRVDAGMPYIGSSAGSNIAGPTIRTTNDMPIVEPPSFDALGLVHFQINPHYVDAIAGSTHMSETREERILQYLEENETPVVGLREGAMVRVEGGTLRLKGSAGARIFRRGRAPEEVSPGCALDRLLR